MLIKLCLKKLINCVGTRLISQIIRNSNILKYYTQGNRFLLQLVYELFSKG